MHIPQQQDQPGVGFSHQQGQAANQVEGVVPVQGRGVAPPQIAARHDDRQHDQQQGREAPRHAPHQHRQHPQQHHKHQLREEAEGFGNAQHNQRQGQHAHGDIQALAQRPVNVVPPVRAFGHLRAEGGGQMGKGIGQQVPRPLHDHQQGREEAGCTLAKALPADLVLVGRAHQQQPQGLHRVAQRVTNGRGLVGQVRIQAPMLCPQGLPAGGFQAQEHPAQGLNQGQGESGKTGAVLLTAQACIGEPVPDHSSLLPRSRHQLARLMISRAIRLAGA